MLHLTGGIVMDIETYEKIVLINGNEYIVRFDESGNAKASRYYHKYKVWLNINFSNKVDTASLDSLLEILKRDYLKRSMN